MTHDNPGEPWQPPPLKKAEETPAWQPPPISDQKGFGQNSQVNGNLLESEDTGNETPSPFSRVFSRGDTPPPVVGIQKSLFVLPALFIAGAIIWGITHQPEIESWLKQSRIRLHVLLRHPEPTQVTSEISSFVDGLLPHQDEAKLMVSDVEVQHQRGRLEGTWSGLLKVQLTNPRYERLDWELELSKTGFNSATFDNAVQISTTLPVNDLPCKPDARPPLLVKEIRSSERSLEIPVEGSLAFQGKTWEVILSDKAALRSKIGEFLDGQTLRTLGEDALPIDSPPAQRAIATYVEKQEDYIAAVRAARQRAEQREEKRLVEKRENDVQAAAGSAQAGWHALEKLSGYLLNTSINQRLIDLAIQRGDAQKVALYQSYQDSNRRNIDDAAVSYEEAIRSLSRLPPEIRQKAMDEILSDVAAGSSSQWRRTLLRRLARDAQEPPNFRSTTWLNEIRQARGEDK